MIYKEPFAGPEQVLRYLSRYTHRVAISNRRLVAADANGIAFRYHVTCLWRRSLRRRSQKDASTWQRVTKLADDWLPKAKILHPWPHQRFAVKYPRWEPYAGVPHVRICAGGAR